MKLVSTADFKTFAVITSSGRDTEIGMVLDKISSRIEKYCGRVFTKPSSAVTEYHNGGSLVLEPKYFPIVSITSINEDPSREFTGSNVDTDNYYNDGRAIWKIDKTKWVSGPGAIKLVYLGGYADSSGVLTNVEDDLVLACLLQSAFIFQRKGSLGVSSVSGGDGSVQLLERVELLPEVKRILQKYRRGMF